ncbi:UTRA domain-containing protein [Streptomyces sp. NPDC002917]|uniref:UTRA domain-containing protein n=1 Tax=Streptomyces sp. NPDC002917 TaxID=3364671 RepID=UPI00369254E2
MYVPRDLAPVAHFGSSGWPESAATRSIEVQETVMACLSTPEEAATLRISSALPVLAITSVAVDATGRVVEAALLVLPGNRATAVFTTHPTTNERGTEG